MGSPGGDASHQTWSRGRFQVATDPDRVDVGAVHAFLSRHSYWARGIPRDVVERSIRHSLVFGLYYGDRQIGFARAITDRATFAYLADVFVDEAWRGHGLGKWLAECVAAHPELQGLRRWLLATLDAHGLYRASGWEPLRDPAVFMERTDPDVYVRRAETGIHPSQGHHRP